MQFACGLPAYVWLMHVIRLLGPAASILAKADSNTVQALQLAPALRAIREPFKLQ